MRGTDSNGGFSTATFTITVNPMNDAPVANAMRPSRSPRTRELPDHPLGQRRRQTWASTYSGPTTTSTTARSTASAKPVHYTPNPNYNGNDTFTFTVSDGALTDSGTITIDVTAVNDAPVATDVPDAEVDEDLHVSIPTTGTDIDNDPLSVSSVTDPGHGTATNVGGALVTDYVGDLNFNGIDVFDFVITDGTAFDTGHVTVTVRPVNDAPVVDNQTFHVAEDTPALLSIPASDVDGDALTWSIVTAPLRGQLFGAGPDLAYSPNFNLNGPDTFVVQVDDGNGGTDTATITVIVDAVNDQPVANAVYVSTSEDNGVSFLARLRRCRR